MPEQAGPMQAARLQRHFEEMFAPWVRDLDLTVAEATTESVSAVMRPGERLNRAGDIVSGQALMAAADTVMVLAIFAACGGPIPCATVDMSTSFLKPATNVDLHLVGRVVRLGRSIVFAAAEISSSADEKLVLTATGTYALPPPQRQT